MLRILSTLILLGIGTFARGQAQEVKNPPPPSEKACEAAYVYSEQIKGLAVLVQHRGKVIYERYAESFGPDKANEIWSGTKSFAPTIAILLEQKGLLRLDEKVHETITEWKGKPRHEQVTVRHLLDFTSGLGRFGDAGGVTSHPDFYGLSLRAPIRTTPGRRWAYGSTSLHVFAELVQRKLRAYAKEHPETPTEIVAFLEKELLDKIGCEIAGWTRDRKGQAGLAFGASMTAREWGKYGQLILDRGRWGDRQLLDPSKLERCFVGSTAKSNYGLNWWLTGQFWNRRYPEIPKDTVAAVGIFGQRLYVIPSRELVIVRFGVTGGAFDIDDRRFLRLLFRKEAQPRRRRL
jgi:CubicO group peptidase (beta-lactamase class C family)